MPRRTDAELLDACRRGDDDGWRALVERYAPLILSIPHRYGMRRVQADDVFADVCLILVKSLGKIRDAQALPQWLIRTTTRATWEAQRKAGRAAPATPADLPALTGAAPPESLVAAIEEEQVVRDALQRISERCRRLLETLYFAPEPPSYDDVASRLRMARGSIGPTRRRCLENLRRHVEPRLGGM